MSEITSLTAQLRLRAAKVRDAGDMDRILCARRSVLSHPAGFCDNSGESALGWFAGNEVILTRNF